MPQLSPKSARDLLCQPCHMENSKRAPIEPVGHNIIEPLDKRHLDVRGPIAEKLIGGRRYTLGLMEEITAE